MKDRWLAVWRLAVALLLYPLALAALIWIWWTARSVWFGVAVIAIVLWLDRSWWLILRSILRKRRPR